MKLYGRDKELFEAQEQRETLSLARAAALREALEAVEGEALEDPNPESEGDATYDRAVFDCAAAVRRLLEKDDANL